MSHSVPCLQKRWKLGRSCPFEILLRSSRALVLLHYFDYSPPTKLAKKQALINDSISYEAKFECCILYYIVNFVDGITSYTVLADNPADYLLRRQQGSIIKIIMPNISIEASTLRSG